MKYSVYYLSRRLAVVDDPSPRAAWLKAHSFVRRCARSRGELVDCGEPDVRFYATENRAPCVSCGDYRAVPTSATRI